LSKSGIPDFSLCGLTLSSCAAFSVSPLLAVKKSLADATLGDVVALASMKSMAQRWFVAWNIRKKKLVDPVRNFMCLPSGNLT